LQKFVGKEKARIETHRQAIKNRIEDQDYNIQMFEEQ
jgi:hypothetical protein